MKSACLLGSRVSRENFSGLNRQIEKWRVHSQPGLHANGLFTMQQPANSSPCKKHGRAGCVFNNSSGDWRMWVSGGSGVGRRAAPTPSQPCRCCECVSVIESGLWGRRCKGGCQGPTWERSLKPRASSYDRTTPVPSTSPPPTSASASDPCCWCSGGPAACMRRNYDSECQ